MGLKVYRKKRKFSRTPEPRGSVKKENKSFRFVVQKHDASHLHYDFRLEMDGVLKSWAVPKGPPTKLHEKRLAVAVEDHPLEYISFKGIIPEGNYGAGTVEIWDSGTYELIEKTGKNIKIILHGKKLVGPYDLVDFKDKNWLLIKAAFSLPLLMPHSVKPMLAKIADGPFNDPNFLYEIKWDGYRALAEIEKGEVRLYSRNNLTFNDYYPEIVESLKNIKHEVLIDGEIVATDAKGKINFQLLQDYRKGKNGSLIYYVFDLLYLDGRDLRGVPLIERKRILKSTVKNQANIIFSDHIEGKGNELFELAKKKNIEGIIAKKIDSAYESTRSSNWQKIKNIQEQEAVICGYTEPRGSREEFGALILGIYKDDKLTYIGHTGGGFDARKLSDVKKILHPLIVSKCPFEKIPKTNSPATWVKPKIVCQVKFSEWTDEGFMRQPIFLGIRDDKKASEVGMEEKALDEKPSGEFSNLDKVFWLKEGYTKGDLINYYGKVADIILPYLKDRPESMNRHPDGIGKEGFFQKDFKNHPPWVKIIPIYSESENKDIHWLICNDKKTLLYMANLGCIELNPWNSRYQTKDKPDYMIIDLDPEGLGFEKVVEIALEVKKVMDKIKVESFVKTSGKTGLHILVPLGAKYTYEQTKQFAEILANLVAKTLPKIASVERLPQKRKKKIYVDFLQNRIGQTLAAPYSVRPVPGALISTPLMWKELEAIKPSDFNMRTVIKRLSNIGDPWKGFLGHSGIDMKKSLDILENLSNKSIQ